ncbi:MAG: hypothetical protein KA743_09230 [Geothrix sp.]|nr:hypothetical protein [Geothrix sp.]
MPGAFSFGDLFRHRLGLERFMYAETVQGRFFQALEIKSGTPMNTDKS